MDMAFLITKAVNDNLKFIFRKSTTKDHSMKPTNKQKNKKPHRSYSFSLFASVYLAYLPSLPEGISPS
jgi:hypothetical protein